MPLTANRRSCCYQQQSHQSCYILPLQLIICVLSCKHQTVNSKSGNVRTPSWAKPQTSRTYSQLFPTHTHMHVLGSSIHDTMKAILLDSSKLCYSAAQRAHRCATYSCMCDVQCVYYFMPSSAGVFVTISSTA